MGIDRRAPHRQPALALRVAAAAIAVSAIAALTWLWRGTQSVNPEDHARVDSSLRELRSLDRTINQDVLRARYQLIDSYEPVLRSYRRIEQLEATIASPPVYLDAGSRRELEKAVAAYRASVTAKQALIEQFKYRSADLKELLSYLPGAGAGLAAAARESGDDQVAIDVDRLLQLVLLYNLGSDESYAPTIAREIGALAATGERLRSHGVKRRVRTLVLNVRRLLAVKPDVDRLLRLIFEEPVIAHEDGLAQTYYAGYAAAEHAARRYRVGTYALCLGLIALVAYGVLRLRASAKALAVANERLEERVAARTRELDARNREMRVVLDNVDQALFTVDLDGHLSRERSAALERWFPRALPGARLSTVIAEADPAAATWIEMGWDQLRDGSLPAEVVLDQLPTTLSCGGRSYQLGYRAIGDGQRLERVLLIVWDVTEAAERARREADQHEQLVVFQHLMRDRSDFMQFFAEGERLARLIAAPGGDDRATLLRAIHTLKGNSALYAVTSVSSVCHDVEARLLESGGAADPDDAAADLARITGAWSAFAARVRALTQTGQRIELSRGEFESLRRAIAAGKSSTELLRTLRHLEREPAERRLAHLAEHARSMARRLGRDDVVVTTEASGVRLDPERWAPFWSAFVHMLRNALDHGIEPSDERLARGKPAAGRLWLSTRQVDDDVVVEIRDDGRGIDWAAVRARGERLGAPASSEDELIGLLLRGGVSTKAMVTEISGRGVGVSACYAACAELGGSIAVASTPSEGTTFRFRIPGDETRVARLTSAA